MKTRITLAALLLVAGAALAEPPGPPPDGGGRGLDRLAILLDLDEGQKAAVKQILDEQMKERKEQWQKSKDSQTRPSREEMQAAHQKMHQEMVEKLRPILSDQQMTKFEALSEGPGPFGGPPHGGHQDKMSEDKGQ